MAPCFLQAVAQEKNVSGTLREVIAIVAGHVARGSDQSQMGNLVSALNQGNLEVSASIISGLLSGSRDAGKVTLTEAQQKDLRELVDKLPVSAQVELISLTNLWGVDTLASYASEIEEKISSTIANEEATIADRVDAAVD